MVGLENTDQIKRQILDHVNNIKPHIPSENLQFKKNNIPLPNGNIIVILQVFPSGNAPHQYDYIFYKRLPDGNQPAEADEVKSLVIQRRKNLALFRLMVNEFGVIKSNYMKAREQLSQGLIYEAITLCELTTNNSTSHFLYDQSYLYATELQNLVQELVEITEKFLFQVGRFYEDVLENKNNRVTKEMLKKHNCSTVEEYLQKFINGLLEIVLNDLDQFEKTTGYTIPEPRQLVDFDSESNK